MDQSTVEAVLSDWQSAEVPDKLKAALRFLETQTRHPWDIKPELISELNAQGLDNNAIEDVAAVGFYFNFINRIADAYDFSDPTPKQQKRQATLLDFLRRNSAPAEESGPAWIKGEDNIIRPADLHAARKVIFTVKGKTDPLFRRSIEYYSAEKWGGARSHHRINIPEELFGFVEATTLQAYQIRDEQVTAVQAAGYTDRELHEITFAAALGAAMPALENLYGILYNQ